VDLRVIGCHGGETPKHRTSAFVVDDVLAIDAGSLTSGMLTSDQAKLEICLVSHAHLDHVRDLATIADNRCQMRSAPLVIAGIKETLDALRTHFFNNLIWPDFTKIPPGGPPTIVFQELAAGEATRIGKYVVRALPVSHTIDAVGFVVDDGRDAIAYSGDTGPTDRFWDYLNQQQNLRGLLMEVSFPNDEQGMATVSGHHTPQTLAIDLQKFRAPTALPTLLYHIKPVFQPQVEHECAQLRGLNLQVVNLQDHFVM
jgi:3',5'-cyclic-nucleotide phosphodiesterase